MPADDDDYQEELRQLRALYPHDRFISYCLPPDQRPGGIKVRYIIRVVSGPMAKEIDIRQTRIIMEVLEWLRDHPDQQEQPTPDDREQPDDTGK